MINNVKIGDIISHPERFRGKRVNLLVEYLGWGADACDLLQSSMRTRSDVTLRDETGCIFSDYIPGLSPSKAPIKILIEAEVEVYQGRPRLRNTVLKDILNS